MWCRVLIISQLAHNSLTEAFEYMLGPTIFVDRVELGLFLGDLPCDGIEFLLDTTNMPWWMSDATLDGPILLPRYQDSFSKRVVVRKQNVAQTSQDE